METWQVSIISLLAGFVLAFVPKWFDRRRRLLSYWKVLRQEIEACHDGALGLEKAGIFAPLGRLPTAIYEEVLKHIVAEGDIKPTEADYLMRYYSLVRQVNDSLNIQAAALEREGKDSARAREEFGRMVLKTARFASDDKDSYYAPLTEPVNRRCARCLFRF